MLSQQTIGFLIERHKNKISLAELLDLYKSKYPNASYIRVARELFDDLKIKHEPEGIYKDDAWIRNPKYNKDYGFNSYFFVEYKQSFLLDYFTVDNGQMVADALNYVINNISYDIVSELEENLNCSARDFLGAYTDVFLDTLQLSEKFNISVLKDYKKQEEQTVQNEKTSKVPENSTEVQEEKAKNTQLQTENERLKAELKAQQDRMTELEQKPQQSAVDYVYHSIYGHSSENFEIIFKVSKIIAEKCDPDNPHSYPTKAQITKYVKQYFNDSEKLCEAIYQVVIPEKVKTRGKPPEGVETFKGFI